MTEWVFSLDKGRLVIQLQGQMRKDEVDLLLEWLQLVNRTLPRFAAPEANTSESRP